jgi:hypothetical protein
MFVHRKRTIGCAVLLSSMVAIAAVVLVGRHSDEPSLELPERTVKMSNGSTLLSFPVVSELCSEEAPHIDPRKPWFVTLRRDREQLDDWRHDFRMVRITRGGNCECYLTKNHYLETRTIRLVLNERPQRELIDLINSSGVLRFIACVGRVPSDWRPRWSHPDGTWEKWTLDVKLGENIGRLTMENHFPGPTIDLANYLDELVRDAESEVRGADCAVVLLTMRINSGGRWPRGWEDLHGVHERLTAELAGKPPISFEEMVGAIDINWLADPSQVALSPAPVRVITYRKGLIKETPENWENGEPNERIWKFLRKP